MNLCLRKFLATVLIAFILAGCAASPIIDQNWISSNCHPVRAFVPDNCSSWSNCSPIDGNSCACRTTNGVYSGTLQRGAWHGYGIYKWNNGTEYRGYWRNGQQYCGIESNGQQYVNYQNGAIIKRGNHKQGGGWGDILAAALVVGAAAYVISESGSGGAAYTRTDTEFAWDYLPGSRQWRCRGVQTGRFAENSKCAGKPKVDNRWPGPE